TFLCPSAPDASSDYAGYFQSIGLPGTPPCILGRSDYAPLRGVENVLRDCAGTGAGGPYTTTTDLRDKGMLGVNKDGSAPNMDVGPGKGTAEFCTKLRVTVGAVADGLSNTIMVAEIAGRQKVYYRGKDTGVLTLNSAWADYNIARRIRSYDTSLPILPAGQD